MIETNLTYYYQLIEWNKVVVFLNILNNILCHIINYTRGKEVCSGHYYLSFLTLFVNR